MTIPEYLNNIDRRYKAGISREHSYRGDLQNLLGSLLPKLLVTNEPARVACGAPDYILTKKGVPVGFIEAKDIGEPLDGKKKHKEQLDRYKASLTNLIITDYLNFRFYVDGELTTSIQLAEIDGGKIVPVPENFDRFTNLISNFGGRTSQTIRSPKKLAEMMAGKARILVDVLEKSLTSDEKTEANTSLKGQMDAFKKILIHDINPKQFADIYSQTIAYGMFAARLHDPSLDTFTRQEAAGLIPKTNPFLRKLFQYVAGYDLDDRIAWIVDGLADLFRATDVTSLLQNFGKTTQSQDPIIHFYETFLAEYDPKLRKSRGVWYTPEPVVNFIVRAVDDILKSEFGLQQGLADTSKTKITLKVPTDDKRFKAGQRKYEQEVHKVQILDPATGTGTFLAEVIKQIYNKFEGQKGIWSNYVEDHLIPRLNGFELLMASYAMAHLKLDMLLSETGYNPSKDRRLKIFLTNSLEESKKTMPDLFMAQWLSDEAKEADIIKRDTPVMVVLGNPPYSVSSTNKSDWIEKMMIDYKVNLNEKNINPLSDDYLKFIRFGQYHIKKNQEGVLAYITNNSFIDGIIHRQMRKSLLNEFDKIYIMDLHGSSTKRERSPDGSIDQNVFDIRQGVSINIFVKNKNKSLGELGEVFHADLWGEREEKYKYLKRNSFSSVKWIKITPSKPHFFFIPKDYQGREQYKKGFSTNDLFRLGSTGIKTERDSLTIQFSITELEDVKDDLISSDVEEFRKRRMERKDGRDWKMIEAKRDLSESTISLLNIMYRPFDYRYTYYTGKTKGFHAYPRSEITPHFMKGENIGLIHLRQNFEGNKYVVMTTNLMTEKGSLVCGNYFISPLYVYNNRNNKNILNNCERTPNFDLGIINKVVKSLGLEFSPEKRGANSFAPIDLLDYIYAVLYSPTYREVYKEFLKIDFPRVPYPKDRDTFWQLGKLGGELRQIHLLEHPIVNNFITTYPEDGNNVISNRITKSDPGFEITDELKEIGKVWINEIQHFDNVPLVAWEFYIGGYQPAQKWLKDRRDRQLTFDEIQHYQKIIVALSETDRLMKEIDQIDFFE